LAQETQGIAEISLDALWFGFQIEHVMRLYWIFCSSNWKTSKPLGEYCVVKIHRRFVNTQNRVLAKFIEHTHFTIREEILLYLKAVV
jgi:hypothetical protein